MAITVHIGRIVSASRAAAAAQPRGYELCHRRRRPPSWPFSSTSSVAVDDPVHAGLIRDLFHSYARTDPSRGGAFLSTDDLRDLLTAAGDRPSEERLRRILDEVDSDKSGTLGLDEFLDGYRTILGGVEEDGGGRTIDVDELVRIFRGLDRNGDGLVSRGELGGLLVSSGGRVTAGEARRILRRADADGSRTVSLPELLAFMNDPDARDLGWRLRSGFRAAFVVGGPRSGKSTLCDRLATEAGMVRCDAGELLREEVGRGSPLGEEIGATMDRGWPVRSSSVMALVRKKLSEHMGWFVALDGFPQSKRNCRDFDKVFGAPEFAIYIELPEEIMTERLLVGVSGIDAKDIEKAENLVKAFRALARPMLKYLNESGVVVHVLDGSNAPSEIWAQLLSLNMLIDRRVKHNQ